MPSKRAVRFFVVILSIFALAVLTMVIATAMIEKEAHISPNYPKIDITPILEKENLSESDYETLFYQTGLGKPAIDELRSRYDNYAERILRFQENFFKEVKFICEHNSPVSKEESIVDENGKLVSGTELAPVHNGDILITKCSHTYGWRNGHAAIVIDAEKGLTLESIVLGTNSTVQDINKWTNFPNFILLRLKDAPAELTDKIAQTALENLNNIPYSLTVGIFSPKAAARGNVKVTHCSHLVWQAYFFYGYDLDSDGGPLVTPNDIANSPLLEVVQVYGVDPGNIWP